MCGDDLLNSVLWYLIDVKIQQDLFEVQMKWESIVLVSSFLFIYLFVYFLHAACVWNVFTKSYNTCTKCTLHVTKTCKYCLSFICKVSFVFSFICCQSWTLSDFDLKVKFWYLYFVVLFSSDMKKSMIYGDTYPKTSLEINGLISKTIWSRDGFLLKAVDTIGNFSK